jgi:hypothetical protein
LIFLTRCLRDEYAPLKVAKQLRRGKRISEIEMRYGKTAANAAVAANPDHVDEVSGEAVKEAWESLERCWEEFDALKYSDDANTMYSTPKDVLW